MLQQEFYATQGLLFEEGYIKIIFSVLTIPYEKMITRSYFKLFILFFQIFLTNMFFLVELIELIETA